MKKKVFTTQTKEEIKADVENDNKVENLRKRLANAKTDSERTQIKAEYKQANIEFLYNQKIKEGNKLYYQNYY